MLPVKNLEQFSVLCGARAKVQQLVNTYMQSYQSSVPGHTTDEGANVKLKGKAARGRKST